jgi:hypothetical protein
VILKGFGSNVVAILTSRMYIAAALRRYCQSCSHFVPNSALLARYHASLGWSGRTNALILKDGCSARVSRGALKSAIRHADGNVTLDFVSQGVVPFLTVTKMMGSSCLDLLSGIDRATQMPVDRPPSNQTRDLVVEHPVAMDGFAKDYNTIKI